LTLKIKSLIKNFKNLSKGKISSKQKRRDLLKKSKHIQITLITQKVEKIYNNSMPKEDQI